MDKNTGWSPPQKTALSPQHQIGCKCSRSLVFNFPANCRWLYSIDLQGAFRSMYSKRSNYASALASGSSSILIPGLPFSFTSFMLLILPRLNNQASRVGGKKNPTPHNIHVSLAGENDRRQHYLEGRRMTRHRAFTAAGRNEQRQRYALSVYERLRGEGRGGERGGGVDRGKGAVKRNWAKEGSGSLGGSAGERQAVCSRYPSKTNLYCITTSRR